MKKEKVKKVEKIEKAEKVEKVEKKEKSSFIYAVGRRKRSSARVRLFKGKGQSLVNGMPLSEYFKDISPSIYLKPFELTKTGDKFYVTAKVSGGGIMGQVGAFLLGVSRTLNTENVEDNRKVLKAANLLMRDPREKERRKFGNAQKARARKQSPKR